MNKIATVIGHFGFGTESLNGQTIKTKIFTEEMVHFYGANNIGAIDTHGGIISLLKSPINVWYSLRSSENVICLPAQNGIKVYVPLLVLLNQIFHRKIHYIVIGGWLPQMVSHNIWLSKMLKRLDAIYVETTTMKKLLSDKGFRNVVVLPNFKRLKILDKPIQNLEEPHNLCTFSRVAKEKGIVDAIEAVININRLTGKTTYTLDIYGEIDKNEKDLFENIFFSLPDYIQYCGSVPYNESVSILKDYFALLFPTKAFTEGIPGTVLDAYSAGVPIISSKWESFADIIDEGITGLGYDFDDGNGLLRILDEVAKDPQKLNAMRQSCLNKSKDYLPERIIGIVNLK